jgi:hypothetical protein
MRCAMLVNNAFFIDWLMGAATLGGLTGLGWWFDKRGWCVIVGSRVGSVPSHPDSRFGRNDNQSRAGG